jgi:hypothetical protein
MIRVLLLALALASALPGRAADVNNYNVLDKAFYPTTYGTLGYCWTSNGGTILPSWEICGSSGSGIAVGSPITGGGANRVLYEGATQLLATAANFTYAAGGAGSGLAVGAGTAATNALRALSISQEWTDGTTGNIGIVGNFDMGATGTATGKLLSLQAGAAGTSEVFSVAQTGQVGATQYSALSPVSGTVLLGSTVSTSAFMAVRDGGVTLVRDVGGYGWVNSSNPGSGTVDTYAARAAAGEVQIGTGSGNALGRITAAQHINVAQTLTDQATITWDMNAGSVGAVTLTASRTMAAPTNLRVANYILRVIQGGTGSYGMTWNAVFKWPSGIAPTLSTAVGAVDIVSCTSDATNLYCGFMGDVK